MFEDVWFRDSNAEGDLKNSMESLVYNVSRASRFYPKLGADCIERKALTKQEIKKKKLSLLNLWSEICTEPGCSVLCTHITKVPHLEYIKSYELIRIL